MKTLSLKIKLLFAAAIIVASMCSSTNAQVFTGGDMNVSFLNGVTINIAPTVEYKYKNFSAGFSPILQYMAVSTTDLKGDFALGAKIYAEYDIWKGILAHLEFKAMYTGYLSDTIVKKGFVVGMPIGVGYQRELTSGLWIKAMALYDPFIQFKFIPTSPLSNPSVSIGFNYVFNK